MWEAASIATLITVGSASVVSILSAIQNSKCINLSLGWGCVSCVRNVPDVTTDTEEAV
jgi:hypothetical protein